MRWTEGGLGPDKKNPARAGSLLVQDGSIESDTGRKDNLARARELLACEANNANSEITTPADNISHSETTPGTDHDEIIEATYVCPDCGAPMLIIETFMRGQLPSRRPGQ